MRLIGSVARDAGTDESGIDFVVRFKPGCSLLDQGALLMELRELLGYKVDVISEGALTGRFAERVEREAIEPCSGHSGSP